MSEVESWRSELTELELVDEIARLRRHIALVSERERKMSEILAARMHENGLDRIEGADYTCRLIEGERLRIDPSRFFGRVRREDFFGAVTVSVSEARRLMGEDDLRAISELVPGRQLRIDPVAKPCERRHAETVSSEASHMF